MVVILDNGTTIVYEREGDETRREDDEKRETSSEHQQPGRRQGERGEENAYGRRINTDRRALEQRGEVE